jgi:hypothetical protein
LSAKINFLRSRTATHPLTITSSLIPKVVLASKDLILADAMDVDADIASNPNKEQQKDCKKGNNIDDEGAEVDEDKSGVYAKGDQDDDEGEDDEDEDSEREDREGEVEVEDDEDSESEDDNGDDETYIEKDCAALTSGPSTIFSCTIRYMDLTSLDLQHFHRVSQVLLIRDEWDAVVDICNKRKMGLPGSAILTGQPGTGKHYYRSWISACKLITPCRQDGPSVLHSYHLPHPGTADCVSGHARRCLHH